MKKNTRFQHILFRIAVVFLIAVLLLTAIAFGINAYVKRTTMRRIVDPADVAARIQDGSYDGALVLGCGVYNNSTPSPLLRERLDAAVNLYQAGHIGKLIMSGDHGQVEYNEVRVMKEYAIRQGVPSEDIFMDHAGFSTYDSVYRAKEVFGAQRILIVSQNYHLYRALYIARALGVEAHGVRAEQRRLGGQTARDLREILARNKDFAFALIKPLPTYLGDPIDLTGSGDVTDDSNEA